MRRSGASVTLRPEEYLASLPEATARYLALAFEVLNGFRYIFFRFFFISLLRISKKKKKKRGRSRYESI